MAEIWQILEERNGERLNEHPYAAEFKKKEKIDKDGQKGCNSQLVLTLLHLGRESGS